MNELVYQIGGDPSEYIQAMMRSKAAGAEFDRTMQDATKGILGFNAASRRVVDQQGDFVSAAKAKSVVQEQLNRIGIQTTAQIHDEIRQVDALTKMYQHDARVIEQLADRKQRLAQELGSVRSGAGQAQQAIYNLGFVINDAQQFSMGWAQGLRAISNQVPLVMGQISGLQGGVRGLLAALRGPAGLILLVEAASTAAVLWATKAGEAKKPTAEWKDELRGVADQMLRIKETQPVFEFETIGAAEEYKIQLQEQADALERQLSARKMLAPITQPGQQPVYGNVITGFTRQYMQQQLAGLLVDIAALDAQIKQMEAKQYSANRAAGATGTTVTPAPVTKEREEQEKITTLLGDQIERRRELQRQMKELADGALAQYTRIELQNRALLNQIELLKRAEEARQAPQRMEPQRPDIAGQQQEWMNINEAVLYGTIGRGARGNWEKTDRSGENALVKQLKELPEATRREMAAVQEAFSEGISGMKVDWANWITGTMEGLTYFQERVTMVLGSVAQFSQAAFNLTGHKGWLKAWKALSLAEAIINTAVGVTKALRSGKKWEAIAIGAVGAAAIAKIISTKVDGIGTTGGGSPVHLTGMGYGPRINENSGSYRPGGVYSSGDQFAQSYFAPAGGGMALAAEDRAVMQRVAGAIERNTEVMNRIEQNGLVAGFNRHSFNRASSESSRMNYLTGSER